MGVPTWLRLTGTSGNWRARSPPEAHIASRCCSDSPIGDDGAAYEELGSNELLFCLCKIGIEIDGHVTTPVAPSDTYLERFTV
jgi:hypothetical protein